MIVAGVDVGARATKVVLLGGGQILSRAFQFTGFDQKASALQALEQASRTAGVSISSVEGVVATGAGRNAFPLASKPITEVSADARGTFHLFPNARTIVDVGAEEARAIKCGQTGAVLDFAMNEKCAAGVGAFVEAMARALDLSVEEMGSLSLQSQKTIPLNSQCVVFAESEVVTLVHGKAEKQDIARAVQDAVASRISCLVRTIGLEEQVVFIGGLARNAGLTDSLGRTLGVEVQVPENPEYVGALGAALMALEETWRNSK
jgi:benzoyl-CoA reductase subunit D